MPRDSHSRPSIAALGEADYPRAAEVLARAFRDNPLNRAVIRSRNPSLRMRCNLHGMRALLPVAQAHGRALVARVKGQLAGGLIAAPPFCYPLPAPSLVSRIRCLLGQGWGVAHRWGQVFELLDALHPTEPLDYLGSLGVEPALQRRGVGTALLDWWLAETDLAAAGAYLETDDPENLRFYGRRGFEVVGETEILGVRIWRMRRPARRPEARQRALGFAND